MTALPDSPARPFLLADREHDPALDMDTKWFGRKAPFEMWEGDHTAFVHIVWHAKHSGWTLKDNDSEIASAILRSRAMAAQKAYARRDALREATERVRAMPADQVTPETVAAMLDALAEEQVTGSQA